MRSGGRELVFVRVFKQIPWISKYILVFVFVCGCIMRRRFPLSPLRGVSRPTDVLQGETTTREGYSAGLLISGLIIITLLYEDLFWIYGLLKYRFSIEVPSTRRSLPFRHRWMNCGCHSLEGDRLTWDIRPAIWTINGWFGFKSSWFRQLVVKTWSRRCTGRLLCIRASWCAFVSRLLNPIVSLSCWWGWFEASGCVSPFAPENLKWFCNVEFVPIMAPRYSSVFRLPRHWSY